MSKLQVCVGSLLRLVQKRVARFGLDLKRVGEPAVTDEQVEDLRIALPAGGEDFFRDRAISDCQP